MTSSPSLHTSPLSQKEEENYRLHRRFDRMARLAGDEGMQKLLSSHAMVIGLGGVGSFVAESLARSGVGQLTLVDFDMVCITNSNRQLQAMKGTIGKPKAEVLAERLQRINPKAKVEAIPLFYNERTCQRIFDLKPDIMVDAIDNITAKCHLLAQAKEREVPIICATGASGRWDPSKIHTADLSRTEIDPLARETRKILRTKYGFPQQGEGDFGIMAVYSKEKPLLPKDLTYDNGEGFRCVCPGGTNENHSCDQRALIYGTASFVTGCLGLHCASLVVRTIVGEEIRLSR